jgi:predicted RNA binding protein YcfA (HicA-like mRNA interferase family)
MKKRKLFQKLMSGSKNISFSDVVLCIEAFGFVLTRVNGSHHIFVHPGVPQLINLQNVDGKAKPYQVRQFLQIVERYDLKMEAEE